MLDERTASWKLLVPGHHRERVLAVGLDAGGVAGLARSWREVVWIPPAPEAAPSSELLGSTADGADRDELLTRVRISPSVNGDEAEYDTVVVAGWPRSEQPDVARLASRLAPNGALASLGFAGSRLKPAELKRLGFEHVRCYAALPAHQPRLYFSTASRAMRSKGLSFHAPGSRRAQRHVWASRHLSTLGVRRHLHHGAVLIASRDGGRHAGNDLTTWLSQQLGRRLQDLVIYAGSESPARKLTALAVAADGQDDFVAKLAETHAGAAAVRRETDALMTLAGTPAGSHVPGVLLEGAWRDCTVHAQRCVPLDAPHQVPRLNDALMRFLVELSHIDRTTMPACKTAAWQRVEGYLRNAGSDAVPPTVARCARRIARAEIAEQHVVCHRTHGDFAPWNVKWHNGHPFVIDWEASEPSGLALSDACHFAYRQASLVGPWPGGRAMLQRLQTTCDELARRADLPDDNVGAALHLWMLDECVARPSAHVVEVLEAASGEQQWPDA